MKVDTQKSAGRVAPTASEKKQREVLKKEMGLIRKRSLFLKKEIGEILDSKEPGSSVPPVPPFPMLNPEIGPNSNNGDTVTPITPIAVIDIEKIDSITPSTAPTEPPSSLMEPSINASSVPIDKSNSSVASPSSSIVPKVIIKLDDVSLSYIYKKTIFTPKKHKNTKAAGNSLEATQPQPTSSSKNFEKKILQHVNASFFPGKLTAILGASGAGKSTLLQLLHARSPELPSSATPHRSGVVLHNDTVLDPLSISSITASVRQDDSHLLPALTARETLRYAALLRLPRSWSRLKKIQRAEEVLYDLGLSECGDTLVGNKDVKGLSGGEKRRLSVGLAMLTDPAVLLLDGLCFFM